MKNIIISIGIISAVLALGLAGYLLTPGEVASKHTSNSNKPALPSQAHSATATGTTARI